MLSFVRQTLTKPVVSARIRGLSSASRQEASLAAVPSSTTSAVPPTATPTLSSNSDTLAHRDFFGVHKLFTYVVLAFFHLGAPLTIYIGPTYGLTVPWCLGHRSFRVLVLGFQNDSSMDWCGMVFRDLLFCQALGVATS